MATAAPAIEIRPQAGKQELFLSSTADLTIYGGAAGGGKTFAELLDLARWVHLPAYRGVLFRRTSPQIKQEGGLWDEAQKLYRMLGARFNEQRLRAVFPSGAVIGFKHAQHEKKITDHKGLQADVIAIDQLEEFTENQFFYLMSRNRGSAPIDSYMRATANPQPGWLANFLQYWWDADSGRAIESRGGQVRWFVRLYDRLWWDDSRQAVIDAILDRHPDTPARDIKPKSCTFIGATIDDNPINLRNNPGYRASLLAMRAVDKERLLFGNWKIRDDEGAEFPAEYFEGVDAETWPDTFDLGAIAVDPSKGAEKGDPSAIVFAGAIGEGANRRIYIDADIKRRPCPEIIEDTAAFAYEHWPNVIGFEANGFQELLAGDFEDYLAATGSMPFAVELINNYAINKIRRIRRIGSYLNRGLLRFRKGSAGVDVLLDQLRAFPKPGNHDDGPDALEMVLRLIEQMARDAMTLHDDESVDV